MNFWTSWTNLLIYRHVLPKCRQIRKASPMFQQSCTADLNNVPLAVARVIQHLSRLVPGKMDRNAFFQILSRQLRLLFNYDRFCINLYDAEREFLNLFTAADGTVVESLSNTRIAKNTVPVWLLHRINPWSLMTWLRRT